MEANRTQTTTYPKTSFEFASDFSDNNDVQTRLNTLLTLNREMADEKSLFQTRQEEIAAQLMEAPINTERAFSLFGLMLGSFPPFAIFSKFIFQSLKNSDDYWIIPLLLFVNFVCGLVGYFSGKLIGRMVAETEKWSWSKMILLSPFIGILWGIMAGGAGGIFIFFIGAIFGAIIAAMVGGVALPVFTIFHRLLKKGDLIERDQFLPIAMGITLLISAFFLGLPIR